MLILSGGGSKGAFQAGVVKSLTDKGYRWDAIAGISVGALNGAFLAQFEKEKQCEAAAILTKFWEDIKGNKSVFKRWFPFGRLHSLWKSGLYDTSPLHKTVKNNLDPIKLANSGVKLLVGAVCLETGQYRYVQGTDDKIQEWVMASSAFPVAFPCIEIDGMHWIDGGVRDQTPITDVLDMNPTEIDVILTGPLDSPMDGFASADAKSALSIALRAANLMADEIFNSDLDRVPEILLPRIKIFSPPVGFSMSEPLTFDPKEIAEMYKMGLKVGFFDG